MPDTRRLIETCARIENVVAGIYDLLATQHREELMLARLWKKTADEERNHELQFKMAEKMYFSTGTVKAGPLDLDRAEAALRKVMQIREYFIGNPPLPRFALDRMIKMEEALKDFHASAALVFAAPRLRKMFEAMMANDVSHVESLRRMRETLPAEAARQE